MKYQSGPGLHSSSLRISFEGFRGAGTPGNAPTGQDRKSFSSVEAVPTGLSQVSSTTRPVGFSFSNAVLFQRNRKFHGDLFPTAKLWPIPAPLVLTSTNPVSWYPVPEAEKISREIGRTEEKSPGLRKNAPMPCVPTKNGPNEKGQSFRQTAQSCSSKNTPVDLNFVIGFKLNVAPLIGLNVFCVKLPCHPALGKPHPSAIGEIRKTTTRRHSPHRG